MARPELACGKNIYFYVSPWASYQIHIIAGCACAGNAGNVSPRRRFQREQLVSDPGMPHGTCVTHVPWCMSGSRTRGVGEIVPGIPGACAHAILAIWQEAHAPLGLASFGFVFSRTIPSSSVYINSRVCVYQNCTYHMADSRLTPSQWETALHCNDVSHWLGASLESALISWCVVNSQQCTILNKLRIIYFMMTPIKYYQINNVCIFVVIIFTQKDCEGSM